MTSFTADEIATIKKLFAWIEEGQWLGDDKGIVGLQDEGITLTEFRAVSDYDSYTLERDSSHIPWVALTDPAEYDRQTKRDNEARSREQAALQMAWKAEIEARERATLAALQAKYR